MAEQFRRYGMAPAHTPVFLSHKPSTETGILQPAILSLFLVWYNIPVLTLGSDDEYDELALGTPMGATSKI